MRILDIGGSAVPGDSKKHVRIPVHVTQVCDQLHLRFEYAPKALEDRGQARELLTRSFEAYLLPEQIKQAETQAEHYLPLKNLITLSVDDPAGYRGACHRQDPVQELFISEASASPGLMKGPVLPGAWQITLSLHSIVTESCHYRLQIWTSEEDAS